MRIRLKYLQWLVFWLMVCVPFSLMAATSEDKVTVPARADFAFAEPYFETLGEGKLPAPAITALLQDAQGWLWIGINNGLVRYDGYRMRKFAHDGRTFDAIVLDPPKFAPTAVVMYPLLAHKAASVWDDASTASALLPDRSFGVPEVTNCRPGMSA